MNSLGKTLLRFWNSSIGKKLIVALTGLLLVGFLLGHMAGNLLIFQGREDLNSYAEFLRHMLHGWGIWIARIGLLGAFFLHIFATVSLVQQNRAARDSRYACDATVQASRSSRIMIWSGLTVVAFVVWHILHFTVRVDPALAGMTDPTDPSRHDVYGMVIAGFQDPLMVLFYIVSISLLCSHLSHGIASAFQTFGLRSAKTRFAIKNLGLAIAVLLWFGFLSVPILVATGGLKEKAAPAAANPPLSSESAKS
ncbi:MAG: succinate dehydrogenase cytochrome b subunit [Verrucomicrobiaceae bacterium]|nr:succinate dehydrogenase cytochrome b subunit [Verrucomicrobiaceae bacterium]